MTLDLRGLSHSDLFKQIRDAVALSGNEGNEVVAFIDAHDNEMCTLIKGFTEIVLDCAIKLEESNGYYMLRIMPSVA